VSFCGPAAVSVRVTVSLSIALPSSLNEYQPRCGTRL
jgi:hypothetical protein